MKRILVATDFSRASERALEYGIQLADALDAAITLVNVFREIPMPVAEGVPVVYMTERRQYVEQQLALQAALFTDRLKVPIETLAVEGATATCILDSAKEVGAGLIIAGVKSEGKGIRRVFGDTLTELARKTDVPLLAVPESSMYCPPENILLGDDINAGADAHLLDPLLEIASVFHSRIYVARVIKKEVQEILAILMRPPVVGSLEKELRVQFEYPVDKDVVEGLSRFVENHPVNMVVMLPHLHFAPERWLVKGHTWSMIFRTKVPLLILPGSLAGR